VRETILVGQGYGCHRLGKGICEGKTLEEQCKVQKLTNTKRRPSNGLPWCMPIEERMTNKALEEE
jgi:hypothetical protein